VNEGRVQETNGVNNSRNSPDVRAMTDTPGWPEQLSEKGQTKRISTVCSFTLKNCWAHLQELKIVNNKCS
jgi:hypothetical protein